MAAPTPARRLWILVTTIVTLSGCGNAPQPEEPKYRVVAGATYMPASHAETEYAQESATLHLPPAHTWPAHSIAATHPATAGESAAPEWYQVGYGRQAADRYWFCSWASTALTAADTESRTDAVIILGGIFALSYYTDTLDPPSRTLLRQEVTNAQHGNLTALRTDVQRNC